MERLILLAFLILAWLLWSGLYKILLLSLGAVSCIVVMWVARRMQVTRLDSFSLHLMPRIFPYWGWLIGEIVRSNLEVARVVLDPKLPISPTVMELDSPPRDVVGQVILANSITLTPGTLTLDLANGRLRVHALTRRGARGLAHGNMGKRVARLMER